LLLTAQLDKVFC